MTAHPTSPPAPERSPLDGRAMSLAEFEQLPEEKPYLQWWDGVVVQKAVPRRPHRILQREIDFALTAYLRAHGGDSGPEGHVWYERGYLVPDVAYWLPSKPQGDDRRSLPPTLAVEIRSPDETMASQREKCRRMREHGTDVCWLIDPAARTAEVFEGNADAEPVAAGGSLTSPLLPGFELPLATLWAALDA